MEIRARGGARGCARSRPGFLQNIFGGTCIEIMDATSEIINRAIKYLVEGLFVAVAAIFVPRHRAERFSARLGIGANIAGFPMRM
jgi:hypothetical protein